MPVRQSLEHSHQYIETANQMESAYLAMRNLITQAEKQYPPVGSRRSVSMTAATGE